MAGPHRVPAADYRGPNRYFLTLCCHARARRFDAPCAVALVRRQLLRTAGDHLIAVHAYCIMPDHMHVLCEGLDESSDLRRFVHAFKQRSAYEFARQGGGHLWQRSFFDRHLRADEDVVSVARYIFSNPVRAGLVTCPQDYPHLGSATMAVREVLMSIG